MKKLYIIRGLPGSGKTTLAHTLSGSRHKEADMYFCLTGAYKYNADKIRYAHDWCYDEIEKLLNQSDDDCSVSNTFSEKWEYERYVILANKYKFEPFIIECQNDFGSIHGVPVETIKKMRDRFQR
jgi:predicted kinase